MGGVGWWVWRERTYHPVAGLGLQGAGRGQDGAAGSIDVITPGDGSRACRVGPGDGMDRRGGRPEQGVWWPGLRPGTAGKVCSSDLVCCTLLPRYPAHALLR